MANELEKKLEEELSFGDIVEITLNPGVDYCARHCQSKVIIFQREPRARYQERAILHILGYFGGMKKGSFRETTGISANGVGSLILIEEAVNDSTETIVCLDPTLHRADAVDIQRCYGGEGLIYIPLSAIASYEILSKKRRGLRVVN